MRRKETRPVPRHAPIDRAATPAPTATDASGASDRTASRGATTAAIAAAGRRLGLTGIAALCWCELTRAAAAGSCEQEIAGAAARYHIPLAVFYAVGLNETGWKGRLQPFSMNIDGRPVASATLVEAVARFREAQAHGARMIDIGCMQINHHYHAARFGSLEAMFDPTRNVDYAARFLRELKEREGTWTLAAARYNAGPNNNPAQKRYVCGVLTKMVASGFGAWTESAREFCFRETVAKASQPAPTP